MKQLIISLFLIITIFGIAHADSCVTKKEVLDAIDVLTADPNTGITYAVCDPCTCSPGYGFAACYEWLAKTARAKEENEAKARNIIQRFKDYELCE